MEHPLFKPKSFDDACSQVVGPCNGIPWERRWKEETPLFVDAIMRHLKPTDKVILDYGCGMGRIAREILLRNPQVEVIGVEPSAEMTRIALAWINDPRFEVVSPQDLKRKVDLAYSIYAFQHIPAVELRDALHRLHYWLKPGGLFLNCCSDGRMAIRFDARGFIDDRPLGVNLPAEFSRLFDYIEPLFDDQTIQSHDILRCMILGQAEGAKNPVPHPGRVFRRAEIEGMYFNGKKVAQPAKEAEARAEEGTSQLAVSNSANSANKRSKKSKKDGKPLSD